MIPIEIYLALIIPLHTIDEIYHCNNIPLTGDNEDMHLVCNWAGDDYEYYTNNNGMMSYRLKKDCKDDNYFEKRARDKYWEEREIGNLARLR